MLRASTQTQCTRVGTGAASTAEKKKLLRIKKSYRHRTNTPHWGIAHAACEALNEPRTTIAWIKVPQNNTWLAYSKHKFSFGAVLKNIFLFDLRKTILASGNYSKYLLHRY